MTPLYDRNTAQILNTKTFRTAKYTNKQFTILYNYTIVHVDMLKCALIFSVYYFYALFFSTFFITFIRLESLYESNVQKINQKCPGSTITGISFDKMIMVS